MSTTHSVALIGANGHLGPSILTALHGSTTPTFKITILTRSSSKSTYPSHPNQTIVTIPDSLSHSSLVTALQGHTTLIIAITGTLTTQSLALINAAHSANIHRIIPADFGSCCSSDPRTLSLIPLYPEKKKVRDHLISLEPAGLTWTSIVCGHFLDYGLGSGLMGIDVPNRRLTVFDGGDVPFSASMLRTVGDAVVGVLRHAEATKNRIVYVQTVRTTQNELIEVVERVVGAGEGWDREDWNSDEFIRVKKEALREKEGDHQITEDLVMVEGIVNTDWVGRGRLDNHVLGMEEMDGKGVEGVVREALGKMGSGV